MISGSATNPMVAYRHWVYLQQIIVSKTKIEKTAAAAANGK